MKHDITARLESFLLEHYKKPDFKLKDLNHRFISEFGYYLNGYIRMTTPPLPSIVRILKS
ncbi:MAG TPA: hypothetical protein VEA37_14610 [Flavobacterium sp.]|nr:hypothetical protein [Flavobacterium sp.]